ncbi:MAG TPA: hypothetical protein VGX78_19055, partial [Pirellulales bacterium]|nr:hypothetical protein [Pirellulales bacterium]
MRTIFRTASCLATLVVFALLAVAQAMGATLARCGEGFLEEVDGYRVLHVKGSAYDMGYQHGALLKDHIRENMHYLFDVKAKEQKLKFLGFELDPKDLIARIADHERKFIPDR